MSIKIGIVGAGQFAQHFIPLFNAHPQVRSVLLADLDEKKRTTAAAKYGVAATCATLDDVLASDVDAVALFTQHWMHGPQAMQALRAGKHVYSAVPCAASVEDLHGVEVRRGNIIWSRATCTRHETRQGDATPGNCTTALFAWRVPHSALATRGGTRWS